MARWWCLLCVGFVLRFRPCTALSKQRRVLFRQFLVPLPAAPLRRYLDTQELLKLKSLDMDHMNEQFSGFTKDEFIEQCLKDGLDRSEDTDRAHKGQARGRGLRVGARRAVWVCLLTTCVPLVVSAPWLWLWLWLCTCFGWCVWLCLCMWLWHVPMACGGHARARGGCARAGAKAVFKAVGLSHQGTPQGTGLVAV